MPLLNFTLHFIQMKVIFGCSEEYNAWSLFLQCLLAKVDNNDVICSLDITSSCQPQLFLIPRFSLYLQIMMFQTRVLLGGMNMYDRYQDWRLDVDNMTYEACTPLCCIYV